MYGQNCLYRLQFDNYFSADKKIEFIARGQSFSFIYNRNKLLHFTINISEFKFRYKRFFIYFFQKTRAQFFMHSKNRINYLTG